MWWEAEVAQRFLPVSLLFPYNFSHFPGSMMDFFLHRHNVCDPISERGKKKMPLNEAQFVKRDDGKANQFWATETRKRSQNTLSFRNI